MMDANGAEHGAADALRLPWMQLYIADYLAETAHLSAAQSGAYLLLTMHYWATGGLPTEDGPLARIARMTPAEWRKSRGTIVAFFSPEWKHKGIDAKLAHSREVAASNASRARNAAKKRWSSKAPSIAPGNAPSMPEAIREDMLGDAQSQSHTQEERKISPSARAVTRTGLKARIEELFEELWAKKPKRDGANPKMPALKKFLRLVPFGQAEGEAKAHEIIDACGRWAEAERKSGREGKETVAQLITWLNQSRWGDYPPSAATIEQCFVEIDTPQWVAWQGTRAKPWPKTERKDDFGVRRGWWFASEWPPENAAGVSASKEAR